MSLWRLREKSNNIKKERERTPSEGDPEDGIQKAGRIRSRSRRRHFFKEWQIAHEMHQVPPESTQNWGALRTGNSQGLRKTGQRRSCRRKARQP